jgi:hypothetical protein
LVKDFKVMDSKAILSRMTNKDFHPDKEVLLEEEPKWEIGMGGRREPPLQNINGVGDPLSGVPDKVEFLLEKNNELHLRVRAKENALLVLSDTYYPGWKAFGNGKEMKIYKANYNFRAIPLKAGEYEVKFIYDPISFKIGALVSLLTLAGIGIYFCIKLDPRRGVSLGTPADGPQKAATEGRPYKTDLKKMM